MRAWTESPIGRRGDAPFWFIDYVGSTDTHPVLYNEVVVDSPENKPLAIDVLHGKPDRMTRSAGGGRVVTRYVWDKPPAVPEEPLAPKLSETLPVVVGSTFASWGDFRDWYRAAVKGFTEPDDQVRRMAAELTHDKKTRDDKLRAIFEFVADDIRYVNYVSGEWWLPNRPQELLARRQGDCDDKAMLLITLLKAIGIEANEALVQTRHTAQPSLLRAEHVAIPLFDHGIAYLPGDKGKPGIWLDATSPESRLGPLPSMDARTVAFFIDEGAGQGGRHAAELAGRARRRRDLEDHVVGVGRGRPRRGRAALGRRGVRASHEPEAARRARAVGGAVPGAGLLSHRAGQGRRSTSRRTCPSGVALLRYGAHSEGLGAARGPGAGGAAGRELDANLAARAADDAHAAGGAAAAHGPGPRDAHHHASCRRLATVSPTCRPAATRPGGSLARRTSSSSAGARAPSWSSAAWSSTWRPSPWTSTPSGAAGCRASMG